jgi:hypothetical protein
MIEVKVDKKELECLLEAAREALQVSSLSPEGYLKKYGRWEIQWATPHFILRVFPSKEGEAWRKREGE